jgi:hypothetical protein
LEATWLPKGVLWVAEVQKRVVQHMQETKNPASDESNVLFMSAARRRPEQWAACVAGRIIEEIEKVYEELFA